MNKLTGVIITKNEEKNIIDCLSCLTFCDEILVIDNNSSDRTVDLVKHFKEKKCTVLSFENNSNFAAMRNFALEKVTTDWVLFVDADERVTSNLQKEIAHVIEKEEFIGFAIPRIDMLWGKKLKFGEVGNISFVRLGKRTSGKWIGKVHEVWEISGKIGKLIYSLEHYPHSTVSDFLNEIDNYSTIRAKELYEEKVTTNVFLIILYPIAKLIMNYIFKKGFKDGVEGFIVAMMMSFHSFLVRGKLWLLWNTKSRV